MKIKKLIKVLECIEGDYKGNLPQDMYDLGSYTRSDDSRIGVADMDFVHLIRAFKKMQGILAEEIRTDTQEGKIAEVQAILDKYVAENRKLRDKVYNYDKGLEVSVSQTNQILKLENRVSELLEERECLKKRIKSFYDSQIPSSVPTATFNYIPNNEEGKKLVDGMKQYLNKERYTLKDRGQCINREKYSLDEVSTDRGIGKKEYGKYIKVHISEKRKR